jgi:hypothetical protein
MLHPRRTWALPALALTLVLAACSTPEDLTTPTLEPQFGSADTDTGIDVAFASTGRIYSLSEQTGPTYEDNGDGTSDENGFYDRALLRRYDSNGNLTWTKEVGSNGCNYYYEIDCSYMTTRALEADGQGYTYSMVSYGGVSEDCYEVMSTYVNKYDASGNQVREFRLGTTASSLGESYNNSVAMAVDSSGNVYAGLEKTDIHYDYCNEGGSTINVVAKYSSSGTLLWQRTSTVGTPYAITVSSSGSVYVAGSTGYARYTNSGGLTWMKSGASDEIIVSGSNIYTRYRTTIRKHDSTGKILWSKSQTGLSSPVIADMVGDGSGNVYMTGKVSTSDGSRNGFVRKLNSSGTVLFTKTVSSQTGVYDDGRGIATLTGSEIYVTGSTQGSLAHTNIGGSDGYLRKLGSTGGTVWTR